MEVAGQSFRYLFCSTMTDIVLIIPPLLGLRSHVPPDADDNTLVFAPGFHLRDTPTDHVLGYARALDLHLHTLPSSTMEGPIPTDGSTCCRSRNDTCCLCSR